MKIILLVLFASFMTLVMGLAVVGSAYTLATTGQGAFPVVVCGVGFALWANFLIKRICEEWKRAQS